MKTSKDWDLFFLKFAQQCADMSYATDIKVGAVIAKEDQIISYSYNGTPPGWDNDTNGPEGATKKETIHAEAFAIAKVARSTSSTKGATLYCTLSPCSECAKLILASGISRVVYRDNYKSLDGVEMLCKDSNIEILQYIDNVRKYIASNGYSKYAPPDWLRNHTGLVDTLDV
jgi:dCMP deaminase